ncbi:MAG: hypothetical protein IJ104_10070 [Methanobrevibacter sp.]|nr:hypothetical protein [Methanobrevibacter sp.]
MEFSRIFTGFTVELNILNDEHLIEHYWETIKNPIRNLWFTFAKGLRIQCHDFYYDNHCKNWKIHFNNSMDELDNQLFDFIDKFSNITYSKKIEYTESQKRILNSTIGVYLGDDYEG